MAKQYSKIRKILNRRKTKVADAPKGSGEVPIEVQEELNG